MIWNLWNVWSVKIMPILITYILTEERQIFCTSSCTPSLPLCVLSFRHYHRPYEKIQLLHALFLSLLVGLIKYPTIIPNILRDYILNIFISYLTYLYEKYITWLIDIDFFSYLSESFLYKCGMNLFQRRQMCEYKFLDKHGLKCLLFSIN